MLQDIRLAFRQLGKSPVFTIVTLLTLARVPGISLLIPAWRATRNDPIHALRSEQGIASTH